MTTLKDNELFDYLNHLDSEIRMRISETDKGSLRRLIHEQMGQIIDSEKRFLKYINSNGTHPILSISPNGLPSVASLNPDLEKMCELAGEKSDFKNIAQKYRKDINGKNKGEERSIYVSVSEEEWSKELRNRKSEILPSQIGFAVNEIEDGKFQLALREDLYLKGYDQYSKNFPVLTRRGRGWYHVVWNRLIDGGEEQFYVPNTALVLKGKVTKSPKKIFDDIEEVYNFTRSDYKGVKKPWPLRWGGDLINYSNFLASGTAARVRITEHILGIIENVLGGQVNLKGIRGDDLESTLEFVNIPFANAPKTTPKEEDFYTYKGSSYDKKKEALKVPTTFDLICTARTKKIGKIEFVLPHNKRVRQYDSVYNLTTGWVELHILGSAIDNESQYHTLQNELERIPNREG